MSSMNLYVGNLPYSMGETELTELFSGYGSVLSAKVITDRDTGRSRGFGFVEMSSRSEGEEAMSALDGHEIDQRRLRVNEARPRTERKGRGFGGRREGGRY